MSSLVTAPRRAAPGLARATQSIRGLGRRRRTDLAFGLGLGAALALAAFVTGGGVNLAADTWTEIILTVLGCALAIGVLIWAAPGRYWGATTLIAFAALAGLTAASISWSVQPQNSWIEANRTLAYVAVFGGALALARLMPARWRGVVGAIAVLTTVLGGYALAVKVFPATLDPQGQLGRLRLPFDYWNAVGLIGALGLPACLWAGARRDRGRSVRALAVPAISILVTVIVLSYSRSALFAAVVGVACWFAITPLRLRGACVLGLGLLGAAALTLWALATDPITHDGVALTARVTAGHAFGLVLVPVLMLGAAAGLLAAFAVDRAAVSAHTRRQIGTALIILVALVPLVAVAGLAASSRGLTGEVSHLWSTLTSTKATVGDSPGRLVALANSRSRDWSQGVTVAEHALLKGVGAQGYGTARTRYTHDVFIVQHAHSYLIETFADLGLLGLMLSLVLFLSWGVATFRTIGRRHSPYGRAPARERSAERIGMLTLLCVVVAFGVSSMIDWTWFVPGVTLPALVCAGWLAGRGPLEEPVGRRERRRRLSVSPVAVAATTGLVALALVLSWAVWQPLRASDADAAALAAAARGDTGAAIADARTATRRDPVAIEPLWELSAIYDAAGDHGAGRQELLKAISVQPANAETWLQLGLFDLRHHHPRQALGVLRRARALDLSSTQVTQAIVRAQAALRAGSGTGPGPGR